MELIRATLDDIAKFDIRYQEARKQGDSLATIMHSEYRWRVIRNQFVQHQYRCQMCGTLKKLEVHHIIPWHKAEDLRYTWDNLVTLCRECHFRYGHFLDWKKSNPEICELCVKVQEMNPTIAEWSKPYEEAA